jgi:hypothetical protein
MENARLRELNRKYARNTGLTFEVVIDDLRDFLAADKTFNAFVFTPTSTPEHTPIAASVFDKDHSEIAGLVISDIQLGETITLEQTNGMNKYNSVICSNRMYKLTEKFKRIVRGHQAMYRIDKIWLLLLGDIINGSIHDEFILTNDLLDIPATILAARLLILCIYELLELGLPIEIDTIVGNHGRTLVKMPAKAQVHTSFDWMVYVMVQDHFAARPEYKDRVKVRIHTGKFGFVEQFGHRVVIEHGYGATSGKEDDLQSRIRDIFDSPVYRKATGLKGTAVDFIIIGDKHNFKLGERYLVNGCLPGSNEFGMELRMPSIGAIQTMFGISRRRIPSWTYPLDVADVQSEKAENGLSTYAKEFMREHGR